MSSFSLLSFEQKHRGRQSSAKRRDQMSDVPKGRGRPKGSRNKAQLNLSKSSVSIAPVSIQPVSPRDPISLFELAMKDRLPSKLERFGPLIFLGDTAVTFAKKRFERDKNFNASADQIDASYGECLRVIELYFRAWQRCGELAEEKLASPAEAGKNGGRGKRVVATATPFSRALRRRPGNRNCLAGSWNKQY